MPFILLQSRYGANNPERWTVLETRRETKAFYVVAGWTAGKERKIAKDEVVAVRETQEECEALRTAAKEAWDLHDVTRKPLTDEIRRLMNQCQTMDAARDAKLAAILKGGAT
jgi:hypothetical protein